jgi:hypothetical protein
MTKELDPVREVPDNKSNKAPRHPTRKDREAKTMLT